MQTNNILVSQQIYFDQLIKNYNLYTIQKMTSRDAFSSNFVEKSLNNFFEINKLFMNDKKISITFKVLVIDDEKILHINNEIYFWNEVVDKRNRIAVKSYFQNNLFIMIEDIKILDIIKTNKDEFTFVFVAKFVNSLQNSNKNYSFQQCKNLNKDYLKMLKLYRLK